VIFKYSFYIELIIWLFPPFKQYKGGLFIYFLIVALTPLFSVVCYHYFKIIPFSTYVVSSIAIIIALQNYKGKGIWIGLSLLIFLTTFVLYLNDYKIDLLINIILRGVIIGYFYFFLLEFLYNKKAINYYFIVLVVYELSIIFKMLTILTNINMGVLFYHLTTIFEILICFYFILFNIENSPQFKFNKK
jgi:hypothetical protein